MREIRGPAVHKKRGHASFFAEEKKEGLDKARKNKFFVCVAPTFFCSALLLVYVIGKKLRMKDAHI